MAADIWTGVGDWSGAPGDWSGLAPPSAAEDADIAGAVTLSGAGVAQSVVVEAAGAFQETAAATLIAGGFFIGQGGDVTFAGRSSIAGDLWVPASVTVDGTVTVGRLALFTGTLTLQGGPSGGALAKLTAGGAPLGGFSGDIELDGDAWLAYAGAAPAVVDLGATLSLYGADARVTFGGVSALAGLSANYGTLNLQGGTANGAGGVTVASTKSFLNKDAFDVDSQTVPGGDTVGFSGTLTNADGATLTIGNAALSAATQVTVGGLFNEGAIVVQGSATEAATLSVGGAIAPALAGSLQVSGDATVSFTGGTVTAIQTASTLQVDGAEAGVLAGGVSPFASLAVNYGSIDCEGGSTLGAGGVTETLDGNFVNLGQAAVDENGGDGGSAIAFEAAYVNDKTTVIGNSGATVATVVDAASFSNSGSFSMLGSATGAARSQFVVASNVAAFVTGAVEVSGDAALAYAGGVIRSVEGDASLELDGAGAAITSGGADALSDLATNYGALAFQGDDDLLGIGGVVLTTSNAFTNAGRLEVDTDPGAGRSAIAVGGGFANYSQPREIVAAVVAQSAASGLAAGTFIGNSQLSAATTVGASTFLNEGALVIQGNASSSVQAMLTVAAAANPWLTGDERISGDAALQYGGGFITNIQVASSLELDGQGATVSNGAGSALSRLAFNFGDLAVEGGTSFGTGGAALTTTTDLANYGDFLVDAGYGAYGSSVSIGGVYVNVGGTTVGNYGASSGQSSSFLAQGLRNYGGFDLGGGAASYAATVSGAASNYGSLNIYQDAALDVTGGAAFSQRDGATTVGGTLSASTVNASGGLIEFQGALTSQDALTYKIGVLGDLKFDAAVDATHAVAFTGAEGTLTLQDPAEFAAVISGFGGIDEIDLASTAVASLSYAGGALTLNLAGGGSETLQVSGAYSDASFAALGDGGGGTVIVHAPAPADVWSGGGDWDGDPANWSLGVPSATQFAIVSANDPLTASATDSALALTLLAGARLTAQIGSTLSIGDSVDNAGTLTFEGGGAAIGGALVNTGSIVIGSTANVTVTAGGLANQGSLSITGSVGVRSALQVAGVANALLAGTYTLSGNASLTFGGGSITTVLADSTLNLYGAAAKVLSGANSALAALSANYGAINLQGDTADGSGGAQLATASAFANAYSLTVDTMGQAGGSRASFGAFTNTGSITIGNSALSADTLVSAANFGNEGDLHIIGDDQLTPPFMAKLAVAATPGPVLSGTMQLSGAATLAYAAGGAISSIEYGASLELDGANAQVLSGAADALSGLGVNAGTLSLQGDLANEGLGGVSLTTAGGFSNYGVFDVDSGDAGGGSAIVFNGAFLNAGQTTIGDDALSAATSIKAASLDNQGALTIQGDVVGDDEALLAISGAALPTIVGQWRIGGHATLTFASGQIGAISSGASLEIDGASANVLSGHASALGSLSLNGGTLTLRGDDSVYGQGGATLSTSAAFINAGQIYIDSNAGDGYSSATFGSAFTNAGTVEIGNVTLSDDDLVSVASLTNEGSLTLEGAANNNYYAQLTVAGSTPSGLAGRVAIEGDAILSYGAGAITSVQEGSALSLYGASAEILSGANSALTALSANYGTLHLGGDSELGEGGVTLSTVVALANDGDLQIDSDYREGGSSLTLGGQLKNAGTIELGNSQLQGPTLLQANGLANAGAITLIGQTEGALAELLSIGMATNTGTIAIDAGGELDVSGAAYTQTAGTTTINGGALAASGINAYGGLIEYQSAVSGGGPYAIGATGDLQFDSSVDALETVAFSGGGGQLGLEDASAFSGTIENFAGSEIIDLLGVSVSGLSYFGSNSSGVLDLTTSGGTGTLKFSGDYTTVSFTTMSDGRGGTFLLHT